MNSPFSHRRSNARHRRESLVRNSASSSACPLFIDTGLNRWEIPAGRLLREWPQEYEKLRASGDRVSRRKRWSLYRNIEDETLEARAVENIMGMIARHGDARPLAPANNSNQLIELCQRTIQAWNTPNEQQPLLKETMELLSWVGAVLEEDGGLRRGSRLRSDLIKIGLDLTPIAAQVNDSTVLQLLYCIDGIVGGDETVLARMLSVLRGHDKIYPEPLLYSTGVIKNIRR